MISLAISQVPHFVVKEQGFRDNEKSELFREYYSFFRFLLNFNDTLELQIRSEQNDAGNTTAVEYLLPNPYLNVSALTKGLRFLKLEAPQKVPASRAGTPYGERLTINRKIRLTPVGNLSKIHDDISIMPRMSDFKGDRIYKIPVTRYIQLLTTDYKWRNTLGTLASEGGALFVRIQKINPSSDDVGYALQCLNYYIYTYAGKLPADEVHTSIRAYQALIAKDEVFQVDISVGLSNPDPVRLAFLRDLDLDALSLTDNQIPEKELREVGEEEQDFIIRLQNTWTLDEVMNLIVPPYTFRDALPGIKHFVPKPFIVPFIDVEKASVTNSQDGIVPENHLFLGTLDDGRPINVPFDRLRKHIFVAGTTGSGKTTTIKHILRQLNGKVPFLIVDPAKREYEDLMVELNQGNRILDFTGDRFPHFNPFIPPSNISLYAHSAVLARMLAVFFPTSPVAYEFLVNMVRQTYMHKITSYRRERGDSRPFQIGDFLQMRGENLRRTPKLIPSFVEFMSIGLQWLTKITNSNSKFGQEAVEHFGRRWEFLKSSLFMYIFGHPSSRYKPIDAYFGVGEDRANYLIEMYNILDSSESNSLFALIVAFLYEYRVSTGLQDDLVHLTVLEEAHRIVPSRQESWGQDTVSSPAQEAGKLLAQMLAEIRALGEGICVADQSPSKVIPDLLINTSTKIVHSILYGVDKECLGSAMSLSERESDYLSYLNPGEAIAFVTDAYQPIYLKVPSPSAKKS